MEDVDGDAPEGGDSPPEGEILVEEIPPSNSEVQRVAQETAQEIADDIDASEDVEPISNETTGTTAASSSASGSAGPAPSTASGSTGPKRRGILLDPRGGTPPGSSTSLSPPPPPALVGQPTQLTAPAKPSLPKVLKATTRLKQ